MDRHRARIAIGIATGWALLVWAAPITAQPAVSFPNTAPAEYPSGVYPPPGGGVASPSSVLPPNNMAPMQPSSVFPPNPTTTAPFDPYSGAANTAPSLGSSVYPNSAAPAGYGAPAGNTGIAPYPGSNGNILSGSPTMAPYGQNPYGQPPGVYPSNGYPGSTPPSLYPNGSNWTTPIPWTTTTATRFLTPRIRYSWVDGGSAADDLGINDFDFSVVAAFPNFLFSTQPLYVAPSFSLHLWQGPYEPVGELPAQAYSAFLDFGWSTDPSKPIGGDIGFRPGVFTDFETYNKYSWRFMGQGMFRIQATPTVNVRGGVVYIDRNDIKLLPAFGVLWTPNAQTRFDIFFPRPMLSQYLTTAGNHDLWWYIGAEYGGGAWTVEESAGDTNRIDINDIRVSLGLEFGQSAALQQGRRTGFFEVAWVTAREVYYVYGAHQGDLKDSFMLRAGWNY